MHEHLSCGCVILVMREEVFDDQTMASMMTSNHLSDPSIPRRRVWVTDLRFDVNDLLFFPLFSLSSTILCLTFQISGVAIQFVFFTFGHFSFDYYLFYLK
jgi:hypothetical protein